MSSVSLRLGMSDHDVVRRLRDIAGVGTLSGPYVQSKYPNGKPILFWCLSNFYDICDFMDQIQEHLGERRRARWQEVKELYLAAPVKRKSSATSKRARESTRGSRGGETLVV